MKALGKGNGSVPGVGSLQGIGNFHGMGLVRRRGSESGPGGGKSLQPPIDRTEAGKALLPPLPYGRQGPRMTPLGRSTNTGHHRTFATGSCQDCRRSKLGRVSLDHQKGAHDLKQINNRAGVARRQGHLKFLLTMQSWAVNGFGYVEVS